MVLRPNALRERLNAPRSCRSLFDLLAAEVTHGRSTTLIVCEDHRHEASGSGRQR
jgi:hypothetical protein